MATHTFDALGFDQLLTSGSNPWASDNSRNSAVWGDGTTLQLAPGASYTRLALTENSGDMMFEDADGSQALAAPAVLNGVSWPAGTEIETEYSYVIRPQGSTDPAEQITIYVLDVDADAHGIVPTARLSEDVVYEFVAGGSDDPAVPYANLVTCFCSGTRLMTPQGPCRVDSLRPGMMVTTEDAGPVPVLLVTQCRGAARGDIAPLRVAPGVLGNMRALWLSPQHRVAVPWQDGRALVPVKALLDRPGISRRVGGRVEYWHVVLRRHHLLRAEGALTESLFLGRHALRALTPAQRAILAATAPVLAARGHERPVLPLLRAGQWRRAPSRIRARATL